MLLKRTPVRHGSTVLVFDAVIAKLYEKEKLTEAHERIATRDRRSRGEIPNNCHLSTVPRHLSISFAVAKTVRESQAMSQADFLTQMLNKM
jgi:hypothetical protein